MGKNDTKEPWFHKGLPFKCTECGQCCTGAPGYTWVSEEELIKIAEHLNMTVDECKKKYTRNVKGRLSLLERAQTYDCIFLSGKKCQIYPVRPTQCKTFPWWPTQLKSEADWNEAALYCEGINHPQAAITPFKKIIEQLEIQNTYTEKAKS